MKYIIILILCLSVSSCADFEGDGQYSKETDKDVILWFDFHNYELVLPLFPLNVKGEYQWQFKGYCSDNNSFSLDFVTVSHEKQTWWQDATNIEIEVTDDDGKSLIKRSGALNSYQSSYKSRNCKTITYQECPVLENEWTTSYYFISDYGGKPHEASSITISNKNKKTSIKKTEHHYYNVISEENIGCDIYKISAKVNKPYWKDNVQGKIRITSGWK